MKVQIKDLSLDFKSKCEEDHTIWSVVVKVVQKLNTIVMRNGRKILKFNVIDQSTD
jgi:hypothetical protein